MFYGHEKTRQISRISGPFRMVGVARIELATPTMSTQCLRGKTAETGAFRHRRQENSRGTERVFALGSRKTHPKVSGASADRLAVQHG